MEYEGLHNTNALGEVQAVLEKVIALDAHSERAYQLLGSCYLFQTSNGGENKLRLFKKSVESYKKALDLNPENVQIRRRIERLENTVRILEGKFPSFDDYGNATTSHKGETKQ